jgi:hypothetical protein
MATEKHVLKDCKKCGSPMENTVRFRDCTEAGAQWRDYAWWIECPKCGRRTADMTHAVYAIEDWNEEKPAEVLGV